MTREEINKAVIDILTEIVDDEDWAALAPEEDLKGKLESMDIIIIEL